MTYVPVHSHPELLDGEILLTNASDVDYGRIGWTSKRRGFVAYDVYGRQAPSLRPVFVQFHELIAK